MAARIDETSGLYLLRVSQGLAIYVSALQRFEHDS
jgi:hypothetical protein